MARRKEPAMSDRAPALGRRFRSNLSLARGLIDVAPLVDVALLLFLFFVMHASFVVQPGITVNLPETSFDAGAEYGSMEVMISQEKLVFFNDERTTLQGLASSFAQAHHINPGATLVIEADGRVPHQSIIQIYNMAMQAGITNVSVATRVHSAREAPP